MKKLNTVLGALAAVAAMSASSAAMAQCTGTGGAALLGAAPFNLAGIAQGAAVSSFISSVNTLNTAFLTQSTAFVGAPGNPRPNQEGGGVWARGIGGEITTKNNTTSTYNIGGVPVTGGINCNTETTLRFAGTQVGTDMARLNWNGWNVHVGAMVGYVGAKGTDTSSAGPLNPLGGTFSNQFDVPFTGIYAAATYGGFFVDGQIRFDYIQSRLNDPAMNGLFNQELNARGLSGTLNLGYNYQLGNGWFIEPSAGIIVSRVDVDPFNVSGTLVLANSPGFAPPGTLQINRIDSTLGRLSVRTGTTIVTDKVIWQPFATASVYHEFESSSTALYAGAPANTTTLGIPSINAALSTDRVGTYGQFALGVAGQLVGTGWLGYVRGDYRTGDRIEGWSLNGGLRYQFTPDPAPLAPKGLIGKSPVLVASPVINWTGWYVGGQFGLIRAKDSISFIPGPDTVQPKLGGALAGGQLGYNYQIGKWVLGVEGNMNWTNGHGAESCPNAFFFTCEAAMSWYGEGVAKVGYALFDRSWYYLKGGVAFAENTVRSRCNTGGNPTTFGVALAGCPVQNDTHTHVGWTVGFGSEFALTNNWSVRSETSYFDLSKERYQYANAAFSPRDVHPTGFISTVGVNYRFAPR